MTSTTTTLATSPNPSISGDSVIIRGTVVSNSGSGFPTGTITFRDNAIEIATVAIDPSTGSAEFSHIFGPVGAHIITATYNGDSQFAISNSVPVVQNVISDTPDTIEIINGNGQYTVVGTFFQTFLQVQLPLLKS